MVLPFLPLLLIPLLKSGRKVKKHGRGSLEKLGEVTESMSQLFSGIRVVKAFGMEAYENSRFAAENHRLVRGLCACGDGHDDLIAQVAAYSAI